ncbi:MAG: (Fe-S)-binding protein [Sulfuritalea sp.]|nr:(Fe-S)-binding protein [Sulfuritalea sp.]
MFGLSPKAPVAPRDYTACSGCSLCFLVCPMWRSSRDPRFTPEGLAKALQCGATASQLAEVIDACSLCGACDPVCPEGIDLTGMIMDLRRETGDRPGLSPISREPQPAGALLLPGVDLRANPELLARVGALLGFASAGDDGADIALALEVGGDIPSARRRRFLDSLDGRTLVVGDGLLLAALRRWLPAARLQSVGEALSNLTALRRRLASADFYVIEPRAYHADHERLVTHYDRLRAETGCAMNLDLQRIAIPATDEAEVSWMLRGRKPARIVVENPADRAAFENVRDVPVLHIAELAEA